MTQQPPSASSPIESPKNGQRLPPPPPSAAKWVRAMVGFGVSAVLGLAPLLGTARVPGFTALLTLFPRWPFDMAKPIIPIAAFLMGTLAAIIQFYATEKIRRSSIRRWAKKTIAVIFLGLLTLLVVYIFSVETVTYQGTKSVSVLVGFYRPDACPDCTPQMSNAECLEHTTLKPAKIKSCWGDKNLNIAYLTLSLLYLTVMGGFGVLVGLYVLKPSEA